MRIYARLRPSPQPVVMNILLRIVQTPLSLTAFHLHAGRSIALAHVPYTERQDPFTRFNKNPSIRFSCVCTRNPGAFLLGR